MSEDGYPTEDELKQVKEFSGNWTEWLELVQGLWSYPNYVWREGDEWHFATGGWSGNEDLIAAMTDNVVGWLMVWESSSRGGKFVFKVRG